MVPEINIEDIHKLLPLWITFPSEEKQAANLYFGVLIAPPVPRSTAPLAWLGCPSVRRGVLP